MLVKLTAYALVKTSIMVYVWIYENNVTFNKKILTLFQENTQAFLINQS